MLLVLAATVPGAAGAGPDTRRQQELISLLVQDCGSCHGGTLRGGLGPALTPEALAGRDPAMLARVILDGRSGTPMAPWKLLMNEQEAEWLVRRLLAGIKP
jgi:cytochrome c55X